MKKFNNLRMVLFDSTNASFKLAVEAQFVRGNQQIGYKDLVYVTDSFTGMLNPNIYLTLACKNEDTKPVFTSYPQLFRLREALEKIKDMVADGSAFSEIDGVLSVRPDCTEPVVLANIGKANNWISFKLTVLESGENGVTTVIPGVSIELSTSNRYVSTLTIDEFLTVYTIIKDLNLANLQAMMSLAFLDVNSGYTPGMYAAPAQVQPMQAPYQQQYAQPYTNMAPRANNGYPTQSYSQPRYNANPQGYGTRTTRQVPPAPTANGNTTTLGGAPRTPYVQQAPVQEPAPQQASLPPRTSKPIMNMTAIEETPISEIDYDDATGFDDIFNN